MKDNKKFEYEIIRSKIKNMYILIKDGKVRVKAPINVSDDKIDKFINLKEDWIVKKLIESRNKLKKEKKYIDGEVFKVLGDDYILKIQYGNLKKAVLNLDNGYINLNISDNYSIDEIKALIEKMYYKIALSVVDKTVNRWIGILNISPDVVVIKKLKTAWGKCNSKKKITINPDLMEYEQKVVDYVVLHEFCHLIHMNHSKDFWNMLCKYMPDYKKVRSKLRHE